MYVKVQKKKKTYYTRTFFLDNIFVKMSIASGYYKTKKKKKHKIIIRSKDGMFEIPIWLADMRDTLAAISTLQYFSNSFVRADTK